MGEYRIEINFWTAFGNGFEDCATIQDGRQDIEKE